MQMTSSRVRTSAAFFLAMMLAAPLAMADQKDDLYAKGTAASATDPFAARDAFCKVKELDATYKDAAAQCTTYTQIADRTTFRWKTNFMDGMNAIQAGDFTTAETKFKNVKGGDYFDKAQQKLTELPALKAKAQEAANAGVAAETASKQKLEQGTAAFNSGNMDAAEAALSGVTGSHQGEAQALLLKVRAYKAAIVKGQAFEGAKDFQAAKNAYAEAVGINPIGPATAMLAKAGNEASAPPPNTAATNPPPVKPPVPRTQIDVATYIADAQKAFAKKQYSKARSLVRDVLRQEAGNQEANGLLAQINTNDTTVSAASNDDSELSGLISSFYQNTSVTNFSDTESQLKFYLLSKGKTGKAGLANFYLGASIMSRFYLTGGTDQNLKRDALRSFKAAKAVDGFKAPEKLVSPKILKAFEEAS